MAQEITATEMVQLINEVRKAQRDIMEVRRITFSHVKLSTIIPYEYSKAMYNEVITRFYNRNGNGYHGIMKEIRERLVLYYDIGKNVEFREYLVHGAGVTDYYDSDNRQAYEQKTGTGEWLRSERSSDLMEVVKEYRRMTRFLRWDYDFEPETERMEGKKNLKGQETISGRKDGKASGKQFPIHIHCIIRYSTLFDHLAQYPLGIETFFKFNPKHSIAGTFVWDLQTIKNSLKKIEFLQMLDGLDER